MESSDGVRPPNPLGNSPAKRVDLHVHSRASTEADEAVLQALRCPESYSEPADVYALAKRRGMNFVTLTDHDTIAGALELSDLPDVLVGEEFTCYFPEDRCKIHLLLWGITAGDHAALQAVRDDIYAVARYVAERDLAHAVAHPLYRQNDKLHRGHVERLLLLFRGFECLNGAHSMLHREAFERRLDALDEQSIRVLEASHGMAALYERPWVKVRTGGSDDHGLFNVGRTWTEFPHEVRTTTDVLACLREGRCRPGGEAGSSVKLAHNFYGVGMRYYAREVARGASGGRSSAGISAAAARLVGEQVKGGRRALAGAALRHVSGRAIGGAAKWLGIAKPPPRGTDLLGRLLGASALARVREHADIASALRDGRAPLAEHEHMFALVSQVTRDVAGGIGGAVADAIGRRHLGELFDASSAVLAQQALLLPYYFALFHQNQERHLLHRITGANRYDSNDGRGLKVGLFTDTFGSDGAAARFARGAAMYATAQDLSLTVYTSAPSTAPSPSPHHRCFAPLVSHALAEFDLELVVPPVLEILEAADRQQLDAVVVNTCGPVGLCGLLAARMLRVPVLVMQHANVPADVLAATNGDYRLSAAAGGYARWLFAQATRVIARSQAGRKAAEKLGTPPVRTHVITPTPALHRPPTPDCKQDLWQRHRVGEPLRLVCPLANQSAADVQLLVAAFKRVCGRRADVALVLTGARRRAAQLTAPLRGLPVHLADVCGDEAIELCAAGEMLVYPAANDVSGQVVLDAQAVGAPVLVGDSGAGREFVDDGVTGLVLPATDAAAWAGAICGLLDDEPRRQRMARNAAQRTRRLAVGRDVEQLWAQCAAAAREHDAAVARDFPPDVRRQTPLEVATTSEAPEVAR